MTDNRYYHLEIDVPLTGSVREERKQIEALPGLEALEDAVGKIAGATFKDGVVRRTGKRVLTEGATPIHPAPKPVKPAA